MLIPLRPLKELMQPDPWWQAFTLMDDQGFRSMSLQDHYADVMKVIVGDGAPQDVQQHFETARNLYVYAFFAHRFLPLVELQAGIAIEAALRAYFDKAAVRKRERSPGLKKLLQRAIDSQAIRDEGFRIWRVTEQARKDDAQRMRHLNESFAYVPPSDKQAYCRILLEATPHLRNSLAHGSPSFHPGALTPLVIAADLINQLFPSQRVAKLE